MSTVYTVNGKVLKNSANYKWLTKKEAPAGFVLNASNVVNTTGIGDKGLIAWEGPNYPNTCNLSGKTLQVNITSTITANTDSGGSLLMYSYVNNSGGPNIAVITETQPGTYTYVCNDNPAESSSFGKYLTLELGNISDIDKIELTILD